MDRFIPEPVKGDPDSLRKGRLIVFACFTVVFLCSGYIVLYALVSHLAGILICSYGILSTFVCLFLLRKEANTLLAGQFFTATSYVFFGAFLFTTYGIETAIVCWLLMVPLSAAMMVSIRATYFWTALTILMLTVMYSLNYFGVILPEAFDKEYVPLVNYLAVVGFLIFGFIAVVGNEKVKNMALKELEESHREIKQKQTELHRKNQEMVAANRELEAKIENRTQSLQLTNEELDTFLYESSHALRRPLVRILGLANIVQLAGSEEERTAYLKSIEVTASGMDIMLQDLLQVSQINNRSIDKRPIRLHTMLKKMIGAIAEEQGPDAPEVKVELSRSWILDTDLFMLEKTFEVVLSNAMQYKREDQTKPRIAIKEQLNSKGLHIMVEDMGQGVHPRALPDIFKMFAKGTEKSKGSGLGLYIARKAMNRIGGVIEAESEYGSWSRFILSFPPYLVEQGDQPISYKKRNPEAIK